MPSASTPYVTRLAYLSYVRSGYSVWICYEVSEPFQNQGYASEAVVALVNELLSIATVIRSEVLKGPAASMKVLERAGLTRTYQVAHGETWERTLRKQGRQ
jgi:RimJ/RimL family protein N-acetyltransferase